MSKFCPYCGTPVVDERSKFCTKCGGTLPHDSPNLTVDATPVQQIQKSNSTGNQLKTGGKWIILCCGGAILCVIIASFFYGMSGAVSSSTTPTLSVEEIKSQAQEIPYASLMRNPENYQNSILHFRGKIIQVQEVFGDNYILRIATKNQAYLGYFDDDIYVNYKGNRLLEDDIVDVWGNFEGLKTYTAILGNQITIPEIKSLQVEIVEAKT
jgi:hypothetical protein